MAPDSCLLEIHSACLNLTLPTQSWHPQTAPSFPQWRAPWPLPINAAPSYWPLLGAEAGPAVEASTVAIGAVASVNRLEHFCSSISAIRTTHVRYLLPSMVKLRSKQRKIRGIPERNDGVCMRSEELL